MRGRSQNKEGQLIADINTDADSAEVNRQIAEIQAAIDRLEKSSQVLSQENFTAYQNELQISLLSNDLENMYNIVEQMTRGTITAANMKAIRRVSCVK